MPNSELHYPPILDLIPHRDPMVLIDKIQAISGLNCHSSFKITPTCIFLEKNSPFIFSELGYIENIAQTALGFLKVYLQNSLQESENQDKNKLNSYTGYISSINNLENLDLAYVNDELNTYIEVELALNAENYKICNIFGEIFVNEQIVFKMSSKMVMHSN